MKLGSAGPMEVVILLWMINAAVQIVSIYFSCNFTLKKNYQLIVGVLLGYFLGPIGILIAYLLHDKSAQQVASNAAQPYQQAKTPTPVANAQTARYPKHQSTSFCTNCGALIQPGAGFCGECGSKVQ